MTAIEYMDGDYLVREHPGGAVERILITAPAQVPPRPTMLVTGITADGAVTVNEALDDATCRVGTILAVIAELRDPGDQIIPLTETFRMPIRARDGREEVLEAPMVLGRVEVAVPMDASGVWEVTEAAINEALPDAMKMHFAGLKIYVLK